MYISIIFFPRFHISPQPMQWPISPQPTQWLPISDPLVPSIQNYYTVALSLHSDYPDLTLAVLQVGQRCTYRWADAHHLYVVTTSSDSTCSKHLLFTWLPKILVHTFFFPLSLEIPSLPSLPLLPLTTHIHSLLMCGLASLQMILPWLRASLTAKNTCPLEWQSLRVEHHLLL